MAETLKYFYLIFSTPDTISLDDYGKSFSFESAQDDFLPRPISFNFLGMTDVA